jgi:hypothetical protein
MLRRGHIPIQRRVFSLTAAVLLVSSSLLIGISTQMPKATAASKNHTVGNVDIQYLMDWGRILNYISWKGTAQTVNDPSKGGCGFIGLVIDHDCYDHTPGYENISDSFKNQWYYTSSDDFKAVTNIYWLTDDATTQKSFASFQNQGVLTGDPYDILINQTAWTVVNKDWAIIEWSLLNLKAVPLTNVSIGLELPLSFVGKKGVGGDGGDDIDDFDAANSAYWAQDDDGTTIGFASAVTTEPITHYYSEDYASYSFDEYKYFYENDTFLYERLHAPNTVVGTTPGNRISTVGWDNFDISAGAIINLSLVIAVNDSFENMITAVQDAQFYYNYVATGFRITEFCDADSGPGNQYIEIYNYGKPPTDLHAAGYRLSVDGGTTFLTGDNWDKKPLPIYEHGVFTLDLTENIPSESGTIGLFHDTGGGNYILVDAVSYGQKGLAPDPLASESTGRYWDSSASVYTNDWNRNAPAGPTWGYQNDVPPVISSAIVMDEVMFDPSVDPDGHFFVIFNTGPGTVDMTGWQIVCDEVYTFTDTIQGYYLSIFRYNDVPATNNMFDSMDATGDNVYLYDNLGQRIDMVGWNVGHFTGMSVKRMPEGFGTADGYNDITSEAAGWVFDRPLQVIVTEISDSESGIAQIEVYNPWYPPIDFNVGFTFNSSSIGARLSGSWMIQTADSDEYAVFNVTTLDGLAYGGDTISFYQNGMLMEEISYGQKGTIPDPLPNESVERYCNESGYTDMWARNSTTGPNFGAQNDVHAPYHLGLQNRVQHGVHHSR